MKINSEDYIQIYLVSFLKKLQLKGLDFLFFHVPNGGNRSAREAGKFKMMGVTPGVPDICLICKSGVYFIELKNAKGKVSKDQKEFIEKLGRLGHTTFVLFADSPADAINQAKKILILIGMDHQVISELSMSLPNA